MSTIPQEALVRRNTLVLPVRPAATQGPKRVDSGALLAGNREIIIEHAGCEYRLRHTQNDKLILTK